MATTSEHANRNRYIVNLAYEGVPERAIARALQLPAYLAMTGDPKLKPAVATLREDLVARNEVIKFYG
jgi:hypothetical protein